jgi:phosphoglycolate phosphatase-like HAD superfamily hydrolase
MLTIANHSWDTFDIYLFDIDGTLINCTDATHYFAFCHTLKQISGRDLTLEGITTHGNTDVGILRDVLTRADVPSNQWRPRLAEARNMMCDFVHSHQHELCTEVLPRVRELLSHLRDRGAKLGVATGNLERIGKLKLQRAGLLDVFDFAGWSDNHESRTDVFRAAVGHARNLYGSSTSICVLGDTPADVQAAHAIGLPVIAVATGIFSYDQLKQEQPEVCLHSFAEFLLPHSDH